MRRPFLGVGGTLSNVFIDFYKNRATMTATYTVDKAHKRPKPPSEATADIHVAGRAPEIGLPAVAEVMNAAHFPDAVALVNQLAGTGQTIRATGAWRLWTEHGGGGPQVQGRPAPESQTTNPDHVFQIHPITRLGDLDLSGSLKPIEGFATKDAHQAFQAYENLSSHIRFNKKTTTILTRMGGYNYVEFVMELNEDQQPVIDGTMVMASVHDLEGELLVRNRRMVFIGGTPPEEKVKALTKGARLHVLGMPRLDLALVAWRTQNSRQRPEVLTWNLPYEMLIVGVYEAAPGETEGGENE